jgi:hypothetical protein
MEVAYIVEMFEKYPGAAYTRIVIDNNPPEFLKY